MRLTTTIRRDGNWYVAQCVEVDVASQGESVEQAIANLREALELYFEDGGEVPDVVEPTLLATIEIPGRAAAG